MTPALVESGRVHLTAEHEAALDAGRAIRVAATAQEYLHDFAPDPSLSSSIAHTIVSRSPAHARVQHPRFGGAIHSGDDSAAKMRGTVIHRLLLGRGGEFAVIEHDDYRTKAAKEARDAAIAEGRTPIKAADFDELQEAASAIAHRLDREHGIRLADPDDLAMGVAENEVCLLWREQTVDGPIWCRAMLDHTRPEEAELFDLKSSRNAHPEACRSHVASFAYHIQAEWYARGWRRLRPDQAGRERFRFIFAETEPPYAVTVPTLSGTFREIGRREIERAIEAFGWSMKRDVWPVWDNVTPVLEPPAWAMRGLVEESEEAAE